MRTSSGLISVFYSYNFHIFRLFGFGKEEVDVYRFMSKQFIALFAGLHVLCRLFLLYNSSQCLAICNVLALATTSCPVQYGYEIFMLERKCYCDS